MLACFALALGADTTVAQSSGELPPRPPAGCATVISPELAAGILLDEAAHPVVHNRAGYGSRYVFHVRVQFTIVRENSGTGGLSPARIPQCLAALNNAFGPWNVIFEERAPVNFLDSDAYFNIDSDAEFAQMHTEHYEHEAIHIFFVNTLSVADGTNHCGISTPSFLLSNGIAVNNSCAPPSDNSTLPHQMGHYLGLFHTHETIFGVECPSGSNCSLTGDLTCDTPADPGLDVFDRVSPSCTIRNMPSPPLVCGPLFPYNPNPANLMSSAPVTCANQLTPGQADRIWRGLSYDEPRAEFLINRVSCWIAFGSPGGDGGYDTPYPSLAQAIHDEPATATRFVIKSGNTPETIRITRPMVLDSFRGRSTIGR